MINNGTGLDDHSNFSQHVAIAEDKINFSLLKKYFIICIVLLLLKTSKKY